MDNIQIENLKNCKTLCDCDYEISNINKNLSNEIVSISGKVKYFAKTSAFKTLRDYIKTTNNLEFDEEKLNEPIACLWDKNGMNVIPGLKELDLVIKEKI